MVVPGIVKCAVLLVISISRLSPSPALFVGVPLPGSGIPKSLHVTKTTNLIVSGY